MNKLKVKLKAVWDKIKTYFNSKRKNNDLITSNNCLLQKGFELQSQIYDMHAQICELQNSLSKYQEIDNAMKSTGYKIAEVDLQIIMPEDRTD